MVYKMQRKPHELEPEEIAVRLSAWVLGLPHCWQIPSGSPRPMPFPMPPLHRVNALRDCFGTVAFGCCPYSCLAWYKQQPSCLQPASTRHQHSRHVVLQPRRTMHVDDCFRNHPISPRTVFCLQTTELPTVAALHHCICKRLTRGNSNFVTPWPASFCLLHSQRHAGVLHHGSSDPSPFAQRGKGCSHSVDRLHTAGDRATQGRGQHAIELPGFIDKDIFATA